MNKRKIKTISLLSTIKTGNKPKITKNLIRLTKEKHNKLTNIKRPSKPRKKNSHFISEKRSLKKMIRPIKIICRRVSRKNKVKTRRKQDNQLIKNINKTTKIRKKNNRNIKRTGISN